MYRFLTPYPNVIESNSEDLLSVSAKLETASGWVDLDDPVTGYELEATSFADKTSTLRKTEVSSRYVAGTFVVAAVRENITETVAVWVSGDTHVAFDARLAALEDAFSQLSYRMMVRFDDSARYWTCMPADYSVNTQREYRHARTGLIKASVPRLPAEEFVIASADEL